MRPLPTNSHVRARLASALFAVFCLVLNGLVDARAWAADAKPSFTLEVAPARARPNEFVTVTVHAAIPAGYHLYSMTTVPNGPKPLRIAIADARLIPAGEWMAPAPKVDLDSRFGLAVETYVGQVDHRRVFKVATSATGESPLAVELKGQICDERQCILFDEQVVGVLVVENGQARSDFSAIPELAGVFFGPDRPPPAILPSKIAGVPAGVVPWSEGLWSFLLLAFLAGLGALLTPCVFPMIPITVSVFSKYTKVSLARSALMAGIYAGAIVFCFTILGVAVSVIFGAVGMQNLSASKGFNLFLFLLLVVFAFNLFGLFEIAIPSGLVSRTAAKERELNSQPGSFAKQALGLVFMALTFTLVSFTCTVGFVGVVLAQAAKGHWFYPALGMLTFSFAFSLPFFFLALSPSWANRLRGKGGDWMVEVKAVLGFLELVGSFKFLSNLDLLGHWGVVTRPLVLTLWTACFLAAGLYLLRVFSLPSSSPEEAQNRTVGPVRMVFALLLLALSVYSSTGIRDTKSMGGWIDGWLPPAVYPGDEGGPSADDLRWMKDDLDAARTEAKRLDRPLFIDFTGYTCTNCRYMEASIFPRAEVKSRLSRMVLAEAYTDCDEPICAKQRAYQLGRFDTAALPFYAILNPFDDAVVASFASSTNHASDFARFLQSGLDAYAKARAGGNGRTNHKDSEDDNQTSTTAVAFAFSGPPVDFRFPQLTDNQPFRLSQLRGHWVLLNFWASWCAPCVKELADEFPPALKPFPDVKLLTVAFDDPDDRKAALDFAAGHGLLAPGIALVGGSSVTLAKLPAEFEPDDTLPATYLLAPDGHIAWKHRGSVDRALLGQVLTRTR